MSLIRTVVVLGAVVYAMPSDPQKQQALIHSASDTIIWGATYCQREPETCRQAEAALGVAVQKAKFGLALASDVASRWSEAHKAATSTVASTGTSNSTLTIEDVLATAPDQSASAEPVVQNSADPSVDG
jgi:hypothetical protein